MSSVAGYELLKMACGERGIVFRFETISEHYLCTSVPVAGTDTGQGEAFHADSTNAFLQTYLGVIYMLHGGHHDPLSTIRACQNPFQWLLYVVVRVALSVPISLPSF